MFLKRLSMSVLLATLLALAVTLSYTTVFCYLSLLLINFIIFKGLKEYFQLMAKKGLQEPVIVAYAAGILLATTVFIVTRYSEYKDHRLYGDPDAIIIFFTIAVLFIMQMWRTDVGSLLVNVAVTISGVMYVAWLLSFIFRILYFSNADIDGRYFVCFFILLVKANDIFAYIVGSLVGRHKLVPRISPNKTIEGAIGGLAGSLLTGIVSSGLLKLYLPIWHIIVLGVIIGFFAQVGDLAESMLKRDAGVKDSGTILPGMGGVLDLIDSLLFSAPIMYFYMRAVL